jgi:hypothetical protein
MTIDSSDDLFKLQLEAKARAQARIKSGRPSSSWRTLENKYKLMKSNFTRELVELYGFTFYFLVVVLVVRIDISQIKAA